MLTNFNLLQISFVLTEGSHLSNYDPSSKLSWFNTFYKKQKHFLILDTLHYLIGLTSKDMCTLKSYGGVFMCK